MLSLALLAAGCGSAGSAKPDGGSAGHDADFSVCSGTPAIPYAPGMSVLSASGAYRATISSASTADSSGASTPTAAIGLATLTVGIATAADGGAAAGDVTMTVPPSPAQVPADPYMPVHKHGASTSPVVAAQGGGAFGVSNVDFFMGGFWELYLDLQAPGASSTDRVTFQICIPTD